MEQIYKPTFFNATDNIPLQEYFDAYKKELYEEQKTDVTIHNKIMSFFQDDEFTEDNLFELNDTISIDHLTVPKEQIPIRLQNLKGMRATTQHHVPGITNEDSLSLHTVRAVKERKDGKNIGDRILFRELRDRSLHIHNNKPETKTLYEDLQPGEQVIIKVRLFCTFTYRFGEPCTEDVMKFDQEITLLGSNTLAALKDAIKCTSDMLVLTEISENPTQKLNLISAKKTYPSSFIFIDGVFYNDFRSKKAIDYSEVIRKWAKEKRIAEFKTDDMCTTTLLSLKPRFGYPYVYQHQGRCEHVFIFSHARLISSSDPLQKKCYPYLSDIGTGKVAYCFICGMSLPVWIVVEYERLPHANTPLCNDCFTSYCYIDGQKVGNFKAYPYVNRNAIF